MLAELNPTGTALIFSSYLGGKLDDRVVGIAVDSTGNIWVTGQTLSQNFPVTPNAPQATNAGDNGGSSAAPQLGDAFLTEIGTSHTIVFSTFLGGSSADWASGIAIDGLGGVIIAGGTASVNFPASQGAYQTKYAGTDVAQVPAGDAIIARFGGSIPAVSISGLSNAASYAGGAIAPGEAVLVSGSGIGPATLTTAQLTASGNVSASVANTQITFNGVPAPIVYVQASIIQHGDLCAMKSRAARRRKVVATVNNVPSPPVTVSVIAALPGIFSADASGTWAGAIFNPGPVAQLREKSGGTRLGDRDPVCDRGGANNPGRRRRTSDGSSDFAAAAGDGAVRRGGGYQLCLRRRGAGRGGWRDADQRDGSYTGTDGQHGTYRSDGGKRDDPEWIDHRDSINR